MTTREQEVYDYLHDFRAEEGKCNLTNRQIRDVIDINDRTLYRVLKSLEEKNLINRQTVSVGAYGKERIITIV